MSKSFFIAGDSVVFIANGSGADLRYRAASHSVPPGVQVPARVNELSETIYVVQAGSLEFMVGGGASYVFAGDFVKIPPKTFYAYRNVGDEPAHLLCRTQTPRRKDLRRLTIEVAA